MEAREAALESDMREVKAILARMEPLLRGIADQVGRLDKRMEALEKRGESFDERLRKLEVETAEMKGKISQLPTAWTLLTGGFGLVLATFGFAFALVRFGLTH